MSSPDFQPLPQVIELANPLRESVQQPEFTLIGQDEHSRSFQLRHTDVRVCAQLYRGPDCSPVELTEITFPHNEAARVAGFHLTEAMVVEMALRGATEARMRQVSDADRIGIAVGIVGSSQHLTFYGGGTGFKPGARRLDITAVQAATAVQHATGHERKLWPNGLVPSANEQQRFDISMDLQPRAVQNRLFRLQYPGA